jgi:hypothetical protein
MASIGELVEAPKLAMDKRVALGLSSTLEMRKAWVNRRER